MGDSQTNYVRLEWEADDEEICSPPTTHLVATVDDLTDMLIFGSEDIDGMDDDAGDKQEPPPKENNDIWWTLDCHFITRYIYGGYTQRKQ